MGGWGGGGGSGGGTVSWGGSSKKGGGWGGGTGGGAPKLKKSDPEHDLGSALVRAAKTIGKVQVGRQRDAIYSQIEAKSKGLGKPEVQRISQALYATDPTYANRYANIVGSKEATTALDYASPAGILNLAGRPVQATTSAVAEATREGGWQHADIGKIAKAASEGLQNKRHDTISSIVQENTGYKLKGVGKFAADLGGGIALDPLTYLSFGTSELAKAGTRGAIDVLGADRVSEVLQHGANALSAEEKVRLAEAAAKAGGPLSPKSLDAFLKGARGGVKVSRPTIVERTVPFTHGRITRPGLELTQGRTIIPGPFAKVRAGKIIESAGAETPAIRSQLAAIGNEGTRTLDKINELEAQAKHLEDAGTDASTLRAQVAELDSHAQDLARQAENIRAEGVRTAAEQGAALQGRTGKILDKVSDSKLAENLRGAFVRRGNIAHNYGQAAADQLAAAKVTANGVEHGLLREAHDTLSHAARETKVTNDELRNVIGPALDVGGDVATVPERLRPMYDALDAVRHRFTQAQIDAGVTVEQAVHDTDQYLTRYMTDAEQLRRNPSKVMAGGSPRGGEPSIAARPSSQLGKRTENLDQNILDINAAHEAEFGVPKFEDNPLPITVRRNAEAARDVANRHYFDQLHTVRDRAGNRLFYTDAEARRLGVEIPKDWIEKDIKGVGIVHAPPEIMSEVTRIHDLLSSDKTLNAFTRGLDHWMNLWKSYATVPLPFGLGFHERNAMGNMFNNWLAGIRFTDPAYGQAARIQYLAGKGVRENGDALSLLSTEQKRIYQEAEKNDVIGEGFFHQDVPDKQHSPVDTRFRDKTMGEKADYLIGKKGERLHGTKGGAIRPLNTKNALIRSGQAFAGTIEGNARLAHFIVMEKRFGNTADAAQSVRKYLFDYSDLTKVEQEKFKRVMAFYTFTRKNLPLQVGALLRTPGKFSHLQTARMAVADTAEAPQGMYPSYLPEMGAVPTPLAVSRGLSHVPGLGFKPNEQNAFAPDLPIYNAQSAVMPIAQLVSSLPGVNKIPGLPHNEGGVGGAVKDLISEGVSGGAPGALLTAIQAFAAEKDFFSGRNLSGNVAAPAWAKVVPGLVKERVLNGKKQPTITAKEQFVVEGGAPMLSKISSLIPQGDYEQEKGPRRRLSMATGLRTYPLGPGAARGEAIRRLAEINAMLAKVREQGVDIPSSRSGSKKSGGGW